jgi:GntR family transcriptional repressor for pyruvate dehydrogenase complex
MATDEATYADVLEVRMGLECNAARLAAIRATDADLRAMQKSLEEMEEDLATTEMISTTSDTAFHMAVTFSTKNPVLIHLTRNFYDFLFVGIKKSLTHMVEAHTAYKDVLVHHQTVFQHIKNREPEKAHDAMRRHILYVQDFFESRKASTDGIPLKHLAA